MGERKNKLDADERHKLLDVDEDRREGELGGARQELERHDVLVERGARSHEERVAAVAQALGAAAVAKALGQHHTLRRTALLVEDEPAQTAVVLPVREREGLVAAVALEAGLVLLPLGHTRGCAERHVVLWSGCVEKQKTLEEQKKGKEKGKREKSCSLSDGFFSLFFNLRSAATVMGLR